MAMPLFLTRHLKECKSGMGVVGLFLSFMSKSQGCTERSGVKKQSSASIGAAHLKDSYFVVKGCIQKLHHKPVSRIPV